MIVTKSDFEAIYSNSMLWKGQDWEAQANRFAEGTSFHWPCAYWFDSRVDMIIARQFLENYGFEYQQTADAGMDCWLIVTDYVADVWVSELAAK